MVFHGKVDSFLDIEVQKKNDCAFNKNGIDSKEVPKTGVPLARVPRVPGTRQFLEHVFWHPLILGKKPEIIAKMRFEVCFWAQSRRLAPMALKS